MEYGSIERDIHIEASPTRLRRREHPEHVRAGERRTDEPVFDPTREPGWRYGASGKVDVVPLTVST